MAKSIINQGLEEIEKRLGKLSRKTIRALLETGGSAASTVMKQSTQTKRHVRTGDMLGSIGATDLRERLGGGEIYVYPQGNDSRGERNATKAYVINYGRGGQKGPHSGDRFITGNQKATEEAVRAAMQAEADRIAGEN